MLIRRPSFSLLVLVLALSSTCVAVTDRERAKTEGTTIFGPALQSRESDELWFQVRLDYVVALTFTDDGQLTGARFFPKWELEPDHELSDVERVNGISAAEKDGWIARADLLVDLGKLTKPAEFAVIPSSGKLSKRDGYENGAVDYFSFTTDGGEDQPPREWLIDITIRYVYRLRITVTKKEVETPDPKDPLAGPFANTSQYLIYFGNPNCSVEKPVFDSVAVGDEVEIGILGDPLRQCEIRKARVLRHSQEQ